MATKYHTLYQAAILVLAIVALSRPSANAPDTAEAPSEQHAQLNVDNPLAP